MRVKSVESWDGSASRWETAEAYCADCLIDVNNAAGREEKAKDYCMLPIREPGDPDDVYVREAVYAAAAGRGIGRVKKPDDVPEEAWQDAVRTAARKIIAAYRAMDEYAPESIYELAGEEAPEEARRAIEVSNVMQQYAKQLPSDTWPVGLFVGSDGMFIITNREGRLYRVRVSIVDDMPTFGEPELVVEDFVPVASAQEAAGGDQVGEEEQGGEELVPTIPRSLAVYRRADGVYRWAAVAATAILNKSGELDSTALFDNFVRRMRSGAYPVPTLDLLHMPGTDIGDVDFVERDGYALIVSGTIRNAEMGEAIERALAREPDYWGMSIAYQPLRRETLIVGGMHVPVYTDGILRKVSIVPRERAASWSTKFVTSGGDSMRREIKELLLRLLGKKELVEAIERATDDANALASQPGVVARDTETGSVSPVLPQEDDAVDREVETITLLTRTVGELMQATRELGQTLADVLGRLEALERAEEKRRQAWKADLPTALDGGYIVRPRAKEAEEGDDGKAVDVRELLHRKGML